MLKNFTTEYTTSEAIVTQRTTERRTKAKYRKNEDGSWAVSGDDGKVWKKIVIKYKDTIIQNNGVMSITPKRIK
ncbi:MAG: hypothetical protein LBS65_00820 [Desulfovibrio sp.]|jgi:hypothetical protein|nr:hypothetical protein [Desulfovibrio sp.]